MRPGLSAYPRFPECTLRDAQSFPISLATPGTQAPDEPPPGCIPGPRPPPRTAPFTFSCRIGRGATGAARFAGIGWSDTDPGSGLTVQAKVRGLVAHEDTDYREWGASGALRVAPGADGRGLTLTVAPAWGAAEGGAERLWSHRDTRATTRRCTRSCCAHGCGGEGAQRVRFCPFAAQARVIVDTTLPTMRTSAAHGRSQRAGDSRRRGGAYLRPGSGTTRLTTTPAPSQSTKSSPATGTRRAVSTTRRSPSRISGSSDPSRQCRTTNNRFSDFEAASRLDAEVGYGLGAGPGRGVVTPYSGIGVGDAGGRMLRLSARWQMGSDATLNVEGTEQRSAETIDHRIMLRAGLRF